MALDLVIRGATVVTPGHQEVADIGIADGRIAQLGGAMAGARELAAGGLLAIPGGIDAHTHLMHAGLGDRLEPPTWVDDFWSGSRAAIAGGITTIGNMTFPLPGDGGTVETPGAAISREMAGAAPEAAVDWFLHSVLVDPAALVAGEVAALAQDYVETRPLYLHLTSERFTEPDAGKYVGAPPLREASDREALWAGLAAGDVDTVCSDHAPWTLDAKLDPALNAVTARQGVADLETLMPMLYSEGVLPRRISLGQFVALTSANAARIFGLYPRKGAIAVGSDADIALWDPAHRRTIDGARMQSLAGYSVYDGWQVQGWPKFVLRRGHLLLADGELTARPGTGEWLPRAGEHADRPRDVLDRLGPGTRSSTHCVTD